MCMVTLGMRHVRHHRHLLPDPLYFRSLYALETLVRNKA